MIFRIFYDFALILFLVASLPRILGNWGKYESIFTKRLGIDFPKIEKGERKLIWIHAVSLGETKAVLPLAKKLKEIDPSPLIVLSTSTKTGFAEGSKGDSFIDYHVFLPLDLSWIVRPIMRQTKPDLVILTETDFWHNFQEAAKQEGASLVVVNGKVSERSFNRYLKYPFIAKRLFTTIDHFYLQGELYRSRFEELGIPAQKLTVTGNIKFDTPVEMCDEAALKQELALDNHPLLTLGSTHDPEEKIWLEALPQLWLHFPQLKVLLVPRHPERFNTVAALLESHGIAYSRWSLGATFQEAPVILVDAMGVLRSCYQISDLAFVGGSFTQKVGGHNILEPGLYGKPVIFGPYMHSQPDMLDLVLSNNAGLQITPEELVPTVLSLLNDTTRLHQLGAAGKQLTTSSQGALQKTFNALFPLLQKPTP